MQELYITSPKTGKLIKNRSVNRNTRAARQKQNLKDKINYKPVCIEKYIRYLFI